MSDEEPAKLLYRYVPHWIESVALTYEGDDCLRWPFATTTNGYGTAKINSKTVLAHRHICRTAHGHEPTPFHEAAHSCGNGHLGCVNPKHLSWKTPRENQADRVLHGTTTRGERHGMAKLTKRDIRAIRSLRGEMSQKEIARMFGVSQSNVCYIQRGKTWGQL